MEDWAEWPDPAIEPQGGWRFDGRILTAPDGRQMGPGSHLTRTEVAQMRGQAVSTIAKYIPSTRFGPLHVIQAAAALVVPRPAGRPKTPRKPRGRPRNENG